MNRITMLLLMGLLAFGIGCRAMHLEEQQCLDDCLSLLDTLSQEYQSKLARLTHSVYTHQEIAGEAKRTDLSLRLLNLMRANDDFVNQLKAMISGVACSDQLPQR